MDTDKYQYSPLSGPRQIRLLKLQSRTNTEDPELSVDLITVPLNSAPPFEALSYAWGDPFPQAEIRCSGLTAKIGLSLHGALRQLAPYAPEPERLIWADALCINQEDTAERKEQVRMMGDIYGTAAKTLIWLGDEDDDVARAMVWLESFDKVWKTFDLPEDSTNYWEAVRSSFGGDNSPATSTALQAAFGDQASQSKAFEDIWMLLHRPWFTRKWVIQEIAKSVQHGVVLVVGSKRVAWTAVQALFSLLEASQDTLWMFRYSYPMKLSSSAAAIMVRARTLALTVDQDATLVLMLVRTLSFICTDPRDHIIALLEISIDGSTHEDLIDYDSPVEVLYRRLVHSCLNNPPNLRLLWSIGSVLPTQGRHSISWMLNMRALPAINPVLVPMLDRARGFSGVANAFNSTTVDASLNGNQLQIKGQIVDRLEQVGMDTSGYYEMINSNDPSLLALQEGAILMDRWLDECQAIFETAGGDGNSYFSAFLTKEYLETTTPEITAATMKDFPAFRQFQKDVVSAVDNCEEAIDAMYTKEGLLHVAMLIHSTLYRRFSRTLHGRIVWAPRTAEAGDLICTFDGLEPPYAVRSRKETESVYMLVGDCFISDALGKETVDIGDVQSEPMMINLE